MYRQKLLQKVYQMINVIYFIKKSTENKVEVVNNNKSYSETQSLNQDLKSIEEKKSNST